jgi:hypothetical protein
VAVNDPPSVSCAQSISDARPTYHFNERVLRRLCHLVHKAVRNRLLVLSEQLRSTVQQRAARVQRCLGPAKLCRCGAFVRSVNLRDGASWKGEAGSAKQLCLYA